MSELRKDSNVIFTCQEHGEEAYLLIKNNPIVPKDFIYCYFPPIVLKDGREMTEKMWVRIKGGDRKRGWGFVENMSVHKSQIQIGETVRFETDERDITRIVGH